jgi:predicted TIM-barrel fold metal-dependent hydrolase
MGTKLDFPVWDADNHLYEAVDAYTRHLPAKYEGAIRFVDVDGRDKLEILGKVSETIPNPTYVVIPTPGAWTEYFRGNNPEGKSLRELAKPIRCPDEFRRPDLRLQLMDEQGIDGCVLFPTTAGLLEEHMKTDVELTHAVVHAYNQWLLEDWTFDYEGRIIPTPVVTLPDVRAAVAELEWCLDRGAKTVLIRPAPVPQPDGSSVSPAYPQFDPFWELCESSGISVMMHNADSGYDRYATDWEPGRDEFQGFNQTVFRSFLYEESRHIFDTLAALVGHGLFARFPRLRMGVVENGGAWVPRLLDCFDRVYKKMPDRFDEHPSDTLRRHVWINPFHEDDMRYLVDALGADRVLFGSDFPHPEGLGDPLEFVDELRDLSPPVVEQVMGANLQALLALDTAGR